MYIANGTTYGKTNVSMMKPKMQSENEMKLSKTNGMQ